MSLKHFQVVPGVYEIVEENQHHLKYRGDPAALATCKEIKSINLYGSQVTGFWNNPNWITNTVNNITSLWQNKTEDTFIRDFLTYQNPL